MNQNQNLLPTVDDNKSTSDDCENGIDDKKEEKVTTTRESFLKHHISQAVTNEANFLRY